VPVPKMTVEFERGGSHPIAQVEDGFWRGHPRFIDIRSRGYKTAVTPNTGRRVSSFRSPSFSRKKAQETQESEAR
jgi:hypothetical protein